MISNRSSNRFLIPLIALQSIRYFSKFIAIHMYVCIWVVMNVNFCGLSLNSGFYACLYVCDRWWNVKICGPSLNSGFYVCVWALMSVEICELSLDSGFYACMWAVMDIKIFRWSLNCRTNLNKIKLALIRILDLALLM